MTEAGKKGVGGGGGGLEEKWILGAELWEKEKDALVCLNEWNDPTSYELDSRHFAEFQRHLKSTQSLAFTTFYIGSSKRRFFPAEKEEGSEAGMGALLPANLLSDWSDVVLKASPWIQCDSPNEILAKNSAVALAEELEHAAALGAKALLVQAPPYSQSRPDKLGEVLQSFFAGHAVDQVPAARRSGGLPQGGSAHYTRVWLQAQLLPPTLNGLSKVILTRSAEEQRMLSSPSNYWDGRDPSPHTRRANRRRIRNEKWSNGEGKTEGDSQNKSPRKKSPKKKAKNGAGKKGEQREKEEEKQQRPPKTGAGKKAGKAGSAAEKEEPEVLEQRMEDGLGGECWRAEEGTKGGEEEVGDFQRGAAALAQWDWLWETLQGALEVCLQLPTQYESIQSDQVQLLLDRWLSYPIKALWLPPDFFTSIKGEDGRAAMKVQMELSFDEKSMGAVAKFLYRYARPLGAKPTLIISHAAKDFLRPPYQDHLGVSCYTWPELEPKSATESSFAESLSVLSNFVLSKSHPRKWEYQASRVGDEVHPVQTPLPANRNLFYTERLAYEVAMADVYEGMAQALVAHLASHLRNLHKDIVILVIGGGLGALVEEVLKSLDSYNVAYRLVILEADRNSAAFLRRRINSEKWSEWLSGETSVEVIEGDLRSLVFSPSNRADFVLMDLFAGFAHDEMGPELLCRLPFLAKPGAPILPYKMETFLLPVQAEALRGLIRWTPAVTKAETELEGWEWKLERWYSVRPSSFLRLGEARLLHSSCPDPLNPPPPRFKANLNFELAQGRLSGFLGFARYTISPITSPPLIFTSLHVGGDKSMGKLPLQPLFFPLPQSLSVGPDEATSLKWPSVGKPDKAFASEKYTERCYKELKPTEGDPNETAPLRLSFRRCSERDDAWYQWGVHPQPVANLNGRHRVSTPCLLPTHRLLRIYGEEPEKVAEETTSPAYPEMSVMLDHTLDIAPAEEKAVKGVRTLASFEDPAGVCKAWEQRLREEIAAAEEEGRPGGFYSYPPKEESEVEQSLYNLRPGPPNSPLSTMKAAKPNKRSDGLPDDWDETCAIYHRFEETRAKLQKKRSDERYVKMKEELQKPLYDSKEPTKVYVPSNLPEFHAEDGTPWREAFAESVKDREEKIAQLQSDLIFLEKELRFRDYWRIAAAHKSSEQKPALSSSSSQPTPPQPPTSIPNAQTKTNPEIKSSPRPARTSPKKNRHNHIKKTPTKPQQPTGEIRPNSAHPISPSKKGK